MAQFLPTIANMSSYAPSDRIPRKGIPKVEGDISLVFMSMTDGKNYSFPSRFGELKRTIIRKHRDAIIASWKRIVTAVEESVRDVSGQGPSIFPDVQFSDIQKNSIDDTTVERIKRTGVCIIRNVIPQSETTKILDDIREYIKANPTTKG